MLISGDHPASSSGGPPAPASEPFQVRKDVLVIDDEESYRDALVSGLAREGFSVRTASNGEEGLSMFVERRPDIVLLDMLLPGMHGIEVCRRMRTLSPTPILMVSAVNSELDVVLGLELGATDYVTKPFHLRELVARMTAILRRVTPEPPMVGSDPTRAELLEPGRQESEHGSQGSGEGGPERAEIRFGRVHVDFVRREVSVGGDPVHLSRREFDLLAYLLSPPSQVRTRDELIDRLWPERELADTRTLDTHVYRLRTKLEVDTSSPRIIVTVRGVGFRLDVDAPRSPSGSRSPSPNG